MIPKDSVQSLIDSNPKDDERTVVSHHNSRNKKAAFTFVLKDGNPVV